MDNCSNFLASLPDNMTESEVWEQLLEEERRETISKIPAFVYMSLLILLGVPGNIIVLLVYKTRFRSSTTKCFIMAMAAFDLCSCLLAMPFEIVDIRFDFQLDIPVGCKIMRFLVALFAYGSVLVLIGVAVDRFKRVCRPYSRQMTVEDSKKGIVIITVIAAAFSLPNLIFYGRQTADIRGLILVDCTIDDVYSQSVWPKLYFVFQGICWFLAIILLSVMYGFIIANIKKANQRRHRLDSSSLSNNAINILAVGGSTAYSNNPGPKTRYNTNKENISQRMQTSSKVGDDKAGKNNGNNQKRNQMGVASTRDNVDSGITSNPSVTASPYRRRSILMRLFSRDVNPVPDQQDGGVLRRGTSRDSSTLETLPEDHEDVRRASEQELEKSVGLENGISLEHLITNEANGISQGENGIENKSLEEETEREHGKIHISASEGNILSDSQGLNQYHKLLSESLQGLNAIDENTNPDATGFKISPNTGRPKSMEHLSHGLGVEQEKHTLESPLIQSDKEGRVSFRISKSNSVERNLQPKASDSSSHALGTLDHGTVGQGDHDDQTTKAHARSIDDKISNIQDPQKDIIKHAGNPGVNMSHQSSPENDHHQWELHEDHNDKHLDTKDACATDVVDNEAQCAESILRDPHIQQSQANNVNSRSSRASIQRQTSTCSNASVNMTSSISGIHKRNQTTMKELKTSKLAMMMFHVTLGFVLSYLPHLSIQIAKILLPDGIARLMCDTTFFGFYHVALRSIYLNHTINPLIYGYYNKRFREYCTCLLTSPLTFLGVRKRMSSGSSIDRTHSFSLEQA